MNRRLNKSRTPHLNGNKHSVLLHTGHIIDRFPKEGRTDVVGVRLSPFLYGNSRKGLQNCVPQLTPILGSRYISACLTAPIISLFMFFDIPSNPLVGQISFLLMVLLWTWIIYQTFFKGGKKYHGKKSTQ